MGVSVWFYFLKVESSRCTLKREEHRGTLRGLTSRCLCSDEGSKYMTFDLPYSVLRITVLILEPLGPGPVPHSGQVPGLVDQLEKYFQIKSFFL